MQIHMHKEIKNNEKGVVRSVKLTDQLSFKLKFGPTYRKQVFNQRHLNCKENQLQSLDISCRIS